MTNKEFDNTEKPSQLIAAAVAVLITGLTVGALEPAANHLVPSAEAKTIASPAAAAPIRLATIVVTATRIRG